MFIFRKIYKKKIFFLGLFFLFSSPVNSITLKEALRGAVTYHPQVLAGEASFKADKAIIDQVEAGFYPSVDLSAQGGVEYIRQDYYANALQTGTIAGETKSVRSSPGITLTQLLFDGASTENKVKRATADFEKSYGQYLQVVDTTALRAGVAYIRVRRLQRLEQLAYQNISAHKSILKKIKTIVQEGDLTEADLIQVQTRLDDAKIALTNVQGDLNVAVADFIEVVGKAPDHLSRVVIPSQFLQPLLNQSIQKALQRNKSLQAAKADVSSAKATLDIVKSRAYPTVTFEVAGTRNQNVSGIRGTEYQSSALVVARYNLMDGGADAARRHEARERIGESSEKLSAQIRGLEQEVRSSWATMKSSTLQASELRSAVKDKNEVTQAYKKQFDVGLRSLLDILNSINDFFLSSAQLITAEATVDTMQMRLLTASSSLLDTFKIPAPEGNNRERTPLLIQSSSCAPHNSMRKINVLPIKNPKK